MRQILPTIVIKIGTDALIGNGATTKIIRALAKDISRFQRIKYNFIIVSSGAIGEGKKSLPVDCRVFTVPGQDPEVVRKQAQAAVGQGYLFGTYEKMFGKRGCSVAQTLVIQDDFSSKVRRLNFYSTTKSLLLNNIIPIINENDVTSSKGISQIRRGKKYFNDNDGLGGLTAVMHEAAMLIIITNVAGVYWNYPFKKGEKPIPVISNIPGMLRRVKLNEKSNGGKGGMESKLKAAKKATAAGIPTYIVGWKPNVISRIVDGEKIGTFLPALAKTKKGLAAT